MTEQLRPGDVSYGVTGATKKNDPKYVDPRKLPNKPDRNRFMNPDKFPRIAPKPKPGEFVENKRHPIEDLPKEEQKKRLTNLPIDSPLRKRMEKNLGG